MVLSSTMTETESALAARRNAARLRKSIFGKGNVFVAFLDVFLAEPFRLLSTISAADP
jgi:hypothetical protein